MAIFFSDVEDSQVSDFHVQVYPNPSNGKFNLKISHPSSDGLKMKDISIYNMFGEKIYPAVHFQINSLAWSGQEACPVRWVAR